MLAALDMQRICIIERPPNVVICRRGHQRHVSEQVANGRPDQWPLDYIRKT
jgi:hypothetical protein